MSTAEKPLSEKPAVNPMLKLLLEFGPLVLFFFTNLRGQYLIDNVSIFSGFKEPIFVATAVFMVAMTVSIGLSYILTRHIAVMPLVSGVVVLVFGGLTLWLADDLFIKIKPTIVNLLFAAILIGGQIFGQSFLKYVFDNAFRLEPEGWRQLTWRWGYFFLFLAVLNEVVWRTQTTDIWVAFKVWGIMPITLVFTLAQLPLMQRYMIEDDNQK